MATPNLSQFLGGVTSAYADSDPAARRIRDPRLVKSATPVNPVTFQRNYGGNTAAAATPAQPVATADASASPAAAPPPASTAPTGYGAGAATRDAIGAGTNALVNAGAKAYDTVTSPVRSAANAVSNFTRGLTGSDPVPPGSATPAQDALAAAPTPAPASAAPGAPAAQPGATQLPTMTVNGSGGSAPAVAGDYGGYNKTATGVQGISKITDPRNPGGAPIYTNMPGLTASELAANNGKLSAGVSTADAGAVGHPGAGVAASELTGGKYTPDFGAFARPTAAPSFDAPDVEGAQRGASSDIASILNEDPRSALGRAARNLRINLGVGHNHRGSRYRQGPTPYQEGIGAMLQNVQHPVMDAQQSALEATRQTGETARTGINAQAGITDALLRRPEPSRIPLADGTIGQVGADNAVRPLLDGQGQPVKALQTKEDATGKQDDEVAKTAATLLNNSQFSAKPLTIDEARAQALQLHGKATAGGRQTATGKDGTKYRLSDDGKSWVKA